LTCLFPSFESVRAYRKGCRCNRCRTGKRKSRQASEAKPFSERAPEIRKKYPVPVGPILDVLEKWLLQIGHSNGFTDSNQTFTESEIRVATPCQILAQELGMKEHSTARMLSRFRNRETTYMSFDRADKIITTLHGPQYWHETTELQRIYEECA
jgi:hypothetical protein